MILKEDAQEGHNLKAQTRFNRDFAVRYTAYKFFETPWRDGRMTCDFTFFPTVFQLYQDDGKVIMIGYLQGNLFCVCKNFRLKRG